MKWPSSRERRENYGPPPDRILTGHDILQFQDLVRQVVIAEEIARYAVRLNIGSHQADQFLYFTGSTKGDVVSSQVGNVHHPQYPGLEDFGDTVLRGDRGTGYIRVDWFTPDGLSTWGDGRLTILGTDGFIEIRKNVDIGGRQGGSHLFLVDQKETRYIDCKDVVLPYGAQLVADVVNRTDTAMPQAHCFLATELMLKAQAGAAADVQRYEERS